MSTNPLRALQRAAAERDGVPSKAQVKPSLAPPRTAGSPSKGALTRPALPQRTPAAPTPPPRTSKPLGRVGAMPPRTARGLPSRSAVAAPEPVPSVPPLGAPADALPPTPTPAPTRAKKPRSDKGEVRLTPELERLLWFIAMVGYVNTEQVMELLGRSRKATEHILYRWISQGLIEGVSLRRSLKVFWLKGKGLTLLGLEEEAALVHRPKDDRSFAHLFAVSTLAIKALNGTFAPFGQGVGCEVIFERSMKRREYGIKVLERDDPYSLANLPSIEQLRTAGGGKGYEHGYIVNEPSVCPEKHRPDLVLVSRGATAQVLAIEVERNVKQRFRIEQIVRGYRASTLYDQVLYLYPQSATKRLASEETRLVKQVRDAAAKYGCSEMFAFRPYDEQEFHALTIGTVMSKRP